MTDVPRYATLRDYLQVLRRSRLIILVAVVLFGLGAYLLTARDKSMYRAQSSLSFEDVELQIANLTGQTAAPTNTAIARVGINAATITRPEIVSLVAKTVPRVPRSVLTSGVSAAEQTSNGFLVIQVQSTNPVLAQRLANAYALAVQSEERTLARSQFAAAARTLQHLAAKPVIRNNQLASTTYQERIANLEFAAETAAPVTIATNAAYPTTAVSPHPVRDALLGLFLGLTLGIVIAFARDALDRRLRGSQQIETELQWPIVGHIKEGALGRAGFVSVNGSRPIDQADLEGFRILRQNIQFLNFDAPPRSIVVTSAKPEEGKSTVAASLACANALTGRLTLLIDCDLRRPSLATRLGVSAEPGLTDYLLGEAEPSEILRTISLGAAPVTSRRRKTAEAQLVPSHVAGSQLIFIGAGRPTAYPGELLSSQRLRSFLAEVGKAYELVVIDASPVLPVADTLELLPEAEGALVCVRASKTTSRELRSVRDAFDRLPPRPTGVVITGVRSGSEADFGYYADKYQYQ